MRHIDQRAVREAPFRQRFEIARETGFAVGAAFEIFEHETRQPAVCHRPQILDRRGALRIAARIKPPGRAAGQYRRRGPRQILPGRRETRQCPAAEPPDAAPAGKGQPADSQRRRRERDRGAPSRHIAQCGAALFPGRSYQRAAAVALRLVKHRVHRRLPADPAGSRAGCFCPSQPDADALVACYAAGRRVRLYSVFAIQSAPARTVAIIAGMDVALIVLLPFLGACVPPLTERSGRNVCAGATAAVTFAALLLLLARAPAVFSGEVIAWGVPWVPQIGLSFSFFIDGLGLFFAALILGIGLLVILYARFYLSREDPIAKFYAYLLLFQGAMVGIVLSDNLLLLIVFWELTSLTSFLLIGYWRHLPQARQGARMALVVTGGGGLALIGGVLLLGQIAGTYQLSELLARGALVKASPLYLPALLLILIAAFTKSAQFPFHFWLPHAMSAPTPVSAYLHSATMVKAGVFLLARLWPVLAGTQILVPDRRTDRPCDNADRGLDRAVQGRFEGNPRVFDSQPARHDDNAARLRHRGGGCNSGISYRQSRDIQGGAVHERRRDRPRGRYPPYPSPRRPRDADADHRDAVASSPRRRWPESRCRAAFCRRR